MLHCCGFCGSAYTSSFVNKRLESGETRRYYYYKCTRKTKHEAGACSGADLRADMIDTAFVAYFRQLAQDTRHLEAVLTAAEAMSARTLTKEAVEMLSRDMVRQMREATINADLDLLMKLIDQVELKDPRMAQELRNMAEGFDYQTILDLLPRGGSA